MKGEQGKSIEENARQINDYIKNNNIDVHLMFGLSYGASIAFKILAMNQVAISFVIDDGGYVCEKADLKTAKKWAGIMALFPLLRLFKRLMIKSLAKQLGQDKSQKIYDKMFSLSNKTLATEMYSFFSFTLPEDVRGVKTPIGLWYGEKEKEKIANSLYIKTRFPNVTVSIFSGYNHDDFFMGNTKEYIKEIYKWLEVVKGYGLGEVKR